ncbi:D-Ala-D-Ala carboxypeptidase family metallohydrolase [Burkholderia sp. Ax-1724]|uniref:D-Ala-D-Ala carboxypeptidase family metallohydrolase n=1 Tax=Burkholderia sp. Ax-1724 TaxID=2608336 RepID=UPI0031F4FD5D
MRSSGSAARLGLRNVPDATELKNLHALTAALEDVRTVPGNKPILISSGFRSDAVNRTVDGVSNSAHRSGLAADFICPGFGTPLQICREVESSDIDFDQVIQEGT